MPNKIGVGLGLTVLAWVFPTLLEVLQMRGVAIPPIVLDIGIIGLVVLGVAGVIMVISGIREWVRKSGEQRQVIEKQIEKQNEDILKLERDIELLRQERKEWRQKLSDRSEIPTLLFKMYERAKNLCKENKKLFTQEDWDAIGNSLGAAHQIPTIIPSADKATDIRQIEKMIKSIPDPFNIGSVPLIEKLKVFIVNLQAAMSLRNTGAIPLTNNDGEYQGNETRVKLLQNDLPNTINTKIEACIMLSNGLASLFCIDFGDTDIPDEFLTMREYLQSSMDGWAQRMRDEISTMIETFILGK